MPAETLPLRDIHLPEPVSWWPPAPGWWLLLFTLMLMILGAYIIRRIRKRRLLRRTVLAELKKIREQYDEKGDKLELVQALSSLMRRASISFYRRKDSAGLTGERWLQHLDNTAQRKEFEHGNGKILARAPYLPASSPIDADCHDLLALCQDWLNNQPVKGMSH